MDLETRIDPHADEVGYFKDEMKGDPIVEFIALKPKMYSYTVCKATFGAEQPQIFEKQVGKGIARAALKQFHHQNYLEMYNEGEATKVLNRRIGSKLHHLYTLSVEKRGLVPYDDKRVLLADLPDGTPNPRTHAFGHYSLADEIRVEQPDQPEAGNDLVIEARAPRVARNLKFEARLERKHKLAVRRARALHPDEMNDDDPDLDSDVELTGDQLEAAQRAASARPGGAQRMEDVIQNILHRQATERPVSPPERLPPHLLATPEAGPSHPPTLDDDELSRHGAKHRGSSRATVMTMSQLGRHREDSS